LVPAAVWQSWQVLLNEISLSQLRFWEPDADKNHIRAVVGPAPGHHSQFYGLAL
jgi:hypothetical protein